MLGARAGGAWKVGTREAVIPLRYPSSGLAYRRRSRRLVGGEQPFGCQSTPLVAVMEAPTGPRASPGLPYVLSRRDLACPNNEKLGRSGDGRVWHCSAMTNDLEQAYRTALDRTTDAQSHWEVVRAPLEPLTDRAVPFLAREQIEAETELAASWVDYETKRDAYYASR
jgi:hypothetical protein